MQNVDICHMVQLTNALFICMLGTAEGIFCALGLGCHPSWHKSAVRCRRSCRKKQNIFKASQPFVIVDVG